MRGIRVDLTGQPFGRLTVLRQVGRGKSGQSCWLCQCTCGKTHTVEHGNLQNGHVQSCGCYRKESWGQGRQKKHGLWKTNRWWLYQSAHRRAKLKGLPFNIKATDIPEIPEVCPILGIPLFRGTGVGGSTANSPTLDRIIPALGYVKGNIHVISQRANVIKNDATYEEIRKVADYMKEITI